MSEKPRSSARMRTTLGRAVGVAACAPIAVNSQARANTADEAIVRCQLIVFTCRVATVPRLRSGSARTGAPVGHSDANRAAHGVTRPIILAGSREQMRRLAFRQC